MKTITDLRRDLAEKAAGDEAFRTAILADPKAVISKELGITIPETVEIAVLEDNATTAHLILTPNPQLSDTDLDHVVGGRSERYTDRGPIIHGGR